MHGKQPNNAKQLQRDKVQIVSSALSAFIKHLLCMESCLKFWAWSKQKRDYKDEEGSMEPIPAVNRVELERQTWYT